MIKLTVFGSSSKGNCFMLSTSTTNVLIDCGMFNNDIADCINSIDGILITHSHLDHCSGIKKINIYYKNKYYSNDIVNNILPVIDTQKELINDSEKFTIKDLTILPFEVYHDTKNYNFLIKDNISGMKILYIIDTSSISNLHFKDIDIFIIEANHSYEWLIDKENLDYKDFRSYGESGHLAVEDTLDFLLKNINCNTKKIILTHISSTCIDYNFMEKFIKSGINNENIDVIAINPHLKEKNEIILLENSKYNFD